MPFIQYALCYLFICFVTAALFVFVVDMLFNYRYGHDVGSNKTNGAVQNAVFALWTITSAIIPYLMLGAPT